MMSNSEGKRVEKLIVTKEMIEEMRSEGLDMLIEIWRSHPDWTSGQVAKFYNASVKEFTSGAVVIPSPIMMGVARELAKRPTVNS